MTSALIVLEILKSENSRDRIIVRFMSISKLWYDFEIMIKPVIAVTK
jgi:hypothetical protein